MCGIQVCHNVAHTGEWAESGHLKVCLSVLFLLDS